MRARCPQIQFEQFAVHSQLLRQSSCVSHPLPAYMLKFSRCSHLSSRALTASVDKQHTSCHHNNKSLTQDGHKQQALLKCSTCFKWSTPLGLSQGHTTRSILNNSRKSASHIAHHISLHPSSMTKPKHSLLAFFLLQCCGIPQKPQGYTHSP